MKTVNLNEIDIHPDGPGRPMTKDTFRARASVIHYITTNLKSRNKDIIVFTARDIARKQRADRAKVADALRWLEERYHAVVPVDTTHQSRRARPELVYKVDTKTAKKTLKSLIAGTKSKGRKRVHA